MVWSQSDRHTNIFITIFFFKEQIENKAGCFVFDNIFTLFISACIFPLLESGKNSVNMYLSVLYPFLYQFYGISIFFPLVIIHYIFGSKIVFGGYSTVTPVRSFFMLPYVLLFILTHMATNHMKGIYWDNAISLFLLTPVLVPLLLPISNFGTTDPTSAHNICSIVFAIITGYSFTVYWNSILYILHQYLLSSKGSFNSIVLVFARDIASNGPQAFLLVDFIVIYLVFCILIWHEYGFDVAILAIIMSIFLGPGAVVALCFVIREQILGNRFVIETGKKNK